MTKGWAMSVSGRDAATGRLDGPIRAGSRRWLRPLLGAAFLAVLVWRLGWGPFLDAVAGIEPSTLAAAAAIAAVTTVCCAWRWSLVARSLGVAVPLPAAVAACYRSQFVNVATPGGVVGDVLRGVGTGREHDDRFVGIRSVVWERSVGQAVQVLLTLAALVLLPSPVPRGVVWLLVVLLAVAIVLLSLARRVRRVRLSEARLVLAPSVWPRLVVASALAVGGHVATFLLAARSVGSTAPTLRVVPLALLVLVSAGLPVNVAGWGPREGAAAGVFGAAGLGAALGLSTAAVFGVLAVVSSLPGAALLVGGALLRRRAGQERSGAPEHAAGPEPGVTTPRVVGVGAARVDGACRA